LSSSRQSINNLLLRAMDLADLTLVEPHLERREWRLGETLLAPGDAIEWVHFVERGVVSLIAEQGGGDQVEIGLIGFEGLTGSPLVMGAERSPHRCMVQVDGCVTWRIPAERLVEAYRRSHGLHLLLLRFVHTQIVQIASTASANAHEALPGRLARWLLMVHDRVDGDRLELTHEFMATMLAVRRSGVTVTLHALQEEGAIRSTRGLVTITDRAKLLAMAVDSYGWAEREYRAVIAPFGKTP
jgi:CRP-like cAMP-binding protein